jgi:hypothetical protein
MIRWLWGGTNQKAYLLANIFMTATDVEPVPFHKMSEKMQAIYDRTGGEVRSFTLPNKVWSKSESTQLKERMQPIDSLCKMSKRYSSEVDLNYRRSLALLIHMSICCGDKVRRRQTLDVLAQQLDASNDPMLGPVVERLLLEA